MRRTTDWRLAPLIVRQSRLLRLDGITIRRTLTGFARRPVDIAIALSIVLGGSAAAVTILERLHRRREYLLVGAVLLPLSFWIGLSIQARLSGLVEGGLLIEDALHPARRRTYVVVWQLMLGTVSTIALAMFGGIPAGSPAIMIVAGAAAYLTGALVSMRAPINTRRRPTSGLGRSKIAPTVAVDLLSIVTRRQTGIGCPRSRSLAMVLGLGIMSGGVSALILARHGSAAAELELAGVTAAGGLFLTRRDVEFVRFLSASGHPPVPTLAVLLCATGVWSAGSMIGALAVSPWHGSQLSTIPIAVFAAVALIAALRCWRHPRMGPRAAELLAAADCGIAAALGLATAWLGAAYLIIRLTHLHRRARSELRTM